MKDHHAGLSAAELCRKHGISDATFYKWLSRISGMEVSDARKLKSLEEENLRLKEASGRAGAGQRHLEGNARNKLLTPGSRREAVNWAMKEKGLSQRRACALAGIDPRVDRYRSRRPDDVNIRRRQRELLADA